MIPRFVRAVLGATAVLCITATSCPQTLGPEGLMPAGDFRLVRTIADGGWEVPAPRDMQAGCGTLIDARLLIGEDGSVLHTRTIRHVQNGVPITTVEEFRPRLTRSSGSRETHLEYRGWVETIRAQVEPVAGDPDFTVLYVDHYFRTNGCPGRHVILRYTVGGVTH